MRVTQKPQAGSARERVRDSANRIYLVAYPQLARRETLGRAAAARTKGIDPDHLEVAPRLLERLDHRSPLRARRARAVEKEREPFGAAWRLAVCLVLDLATPSTD
jgi:hypothetical protein